MDVNMEQAIRGKVSAGRVVIPVGWRKEYGIEDGTDVIFTRTEHGIEIKTIAQALKEAQLFFAAIKKPGESLVDELIRERREEAARE